MNNIKFRLVYSALLCGALFSSGCGEKPKNELNKNTIQIQPGVLLELVPISSNMLFGKYEVTQAQWESIMGNNPSRFKGSDNPVENISWNDCQEFLKKLNSISSVQESGLIFRLPTKYEWEDACRAGAKGDYCKLTNETEITEASLGLVAWYEDNSDNKTHAVGQKEPNAFGLYDILGNVWEWCQNTGKQVLTYKDGQRYWEEDTRDLRGGGWDILARGCGHSAQYVVPISAPPSVQSFRDFTSIGFRVCAVHSMIPDIIAGMTPIPGKNFKMGKTEVTQAQWEEVMGNNPSRVWASNNPVDRVSWQDCQIFLEKLNSHPLVQKSGLLFRLPTEEEWEYSCRAGSTGPFCKLANGEEIQESTLNEVAWFGDRYRGASYPVGEKTPNAYGLFDMHGNVFEWTSTENEDGFVVRGGSWNNPANACEASCRISGCPPSNKEPILGFRLCADNKSK